MATLNSLQPMPDQQLARLVRDTWPPEWWPTAMAVAIAESGARPDAAGDPLKIYRPELRLQYQKYAADGFTSIGLWQINMPSHRDILAELTGSTDPNIWAAWLSDPNNNARLAVDIARARQNAGLNPFSAWTVYNRGAHLPFLIRANEALAAIGAWSHEIDRSAVPIQYTVKPGDTLSDIAARYLGDSALWPVIWQENRDTIGDDPDRIIPGQLLIIPGRVREPQPKAPDGTPAPRTHVSVELDRIAETIATMRAAIAALEHVREQLKQWQTLA